jgi:FMN phosphatase YigB (HAD superfamily)
MTPTAPVRSVFFDVDFTLIYPGPAFQGEGYRRFCASYGIQVDAGRFDEAVRTSASILERLDDPSYDHELFVRYTTSIIEHMGGRGAGVPRAARDIADEWACNHHFEIYDDVEPALRDLVARGLTIGIISNSHRCLDAFREHFALGGLIHAAVSSFEHGYLKPHPSIFGAALSRAGADAASSVMVGDSVAADVRGALQAGLRAVLLRRSGEHPPDLPPGVPVIRALTDLVRHL